MPILQGAVTFARFSAAESKQRPKDLRRSLARDLRGESFQPLDTLGEQERATGWVELYDHESVELPPARFLFGPHLMVTYRVDQRRVPAALVKRTLDDWAKDYAQRQGRPPKRTERTEQKELIIKGLRKQAFVTTKTFDVSWNLDTNEVLVWSSARKTIDEIQVALEETFDLQLTTRSPGRLAEASNASPVVLAPTIDLFGVDFAPQEGNHGEA